MRYFKTRLLRKELVAKETWAIYLDKPANFNFLAGQYVDLYLPDFKPTEYDIDYRTLSMASSPLDPEICFVFRSRQTPYKKALLNLAENSQLVITQAGGLLLLPQETQRPVAFLAGGVGIAPFISMIKFSLEKKEQRPLYLFYFNNLPEEASFLAELTDLAAKNPVFKLIPFFTKQKETITPQFLSETIEDLIKTIFYLAGPPGMIWEMRTVLTNLEIPYQNIVTESFTGY